MKKMIWLVCYIGLLTGASTLNAATEMQKRVPVRFSYESGNGNFNEDTGWQTLVPYWSQFRGYLLANSIPYGFTASAYLVFAFNPEEVYAGNSFPCRVWLEPSDEEGIKELYSDFGFELGVEFRNYWVDESRWGCPKISASTSRGTDRCRWATRCWAAWTMSISSAFPLTSYCPVPARP